MLNLLLLMAVGFLPFPTKLMAEAIHDEAAARTAVIFYGAALLGDLAPRQAPRGARLPSTVTSSRRR